jgi:hypothetical protein
MNDVAKTDSDKTAVRPFHVSISEADLADMRKRIKATRWPERETIGDESQGVKLAMMQDLARYWAADYDWRKVESRLNDFQQFTTEIDGLEFHFIHARSKHAKALPPAFPRKLPRHNHILGRLEISTNKDARWLENSPVKAETLLANSTTLLSTLLLWAYSMRKWQPEFRHL